MKSVVIDDDYEYDKWLLKQRDTITPVWAQVILDMAEDGPLTPAHAKPILGEEKMGETVGGTVSRKGKFGFTCESCLWVPAKGGIADWVPGMFGSYHGLHFPERCRRCKAKMKRYTCAAKNYNQLKLLKIIKGRHNLKFVTWTRPEWNITIPWPAIDFVEKSVSDNHRTATVDDHGQKPKKNRDVDTPHVDKYTPTSLWSKADELKKMATRQFRNWRDRNKYWKSREATGQAYYECTMKPVWKGWGWDEVQLHFHIHSVICSKRIENKDIQIDLDTLEPIPMSTTIQREWGGIVDVRKCRTWKHKDGETKTSKRFVIRYLVDYITKSPHWQSTKFGDWSG